MAGDAQKTRSSDFDEVIWQTRRNMRYFLMRRLLSNSHHGIPDISAEKIVAISIAQVGKDDHNWKERNNGV